MPSFSKPLSKRSANEERRTDLRCAGRGTLCQSCCYRQDRFLEGPACPAWKIASPARLPSGRTSAQAGTLKRVQHRACARGRGGFRAHSRSPSPPIRPSGPNSASAKSSGRWMLLEHNPVIEVGRYVTNGKRERIIAAPLTMAHRPVRCLEAHRYRDGTGMRSQCEAALLRMARQSGVSNRRSVPWKVGAGGTAASRHGPAWIESGNIDLIYASRQPKKEVSP